MEDKIEVNEYVRTQIEDIVKHSKQPIDLIEDKDIVEIELSEEFVEKKDKKKLIQIGDIYTKETLQKDIDNGIITRILTILPYNQYMANCYKVGGKMNREIKFRGKSKRRMALWGFNNNETFYKRRYISNRRF